MAPEELIKEWLEKAEEDFGFAVKTLADPSITYYIETRYPVHWPSKINKEEAQKAKEAVEKIRNSILIALKSA